MASVLWSTLAGAVAFLCYSRYQTMKWWAAILIAVAVFSHWLLDVIVHQPELPIAGANSPTIGLGLWQAMPVALVVEAIFVLVGLFLFLPGSGLSRGKSLGLALLSVVILVFTVVGMTIAPPPPSTVAMAGSSLVTLTIVCTLALWLGSHPRTAQA
jgi:hypothetical protein